MLLLQQFQLFAYSDKAAAIRCIQQSVESVLWRLVFSFELIEDREVNLDLVLQLVGSNLREPYVDRIPNETGNVAVESLP